MADINEVSSTDFFRDRGFAGTMGFGDKPALIVIDFMNGFTDPSMPLGASSDSAVAQTNRLIDAAHTTKIPVFFTSIQYADKSLADAGVWLRKIAGLNSLLANSAAVEQDARLHQAEGDTLVIKKYASSFFGTDLFSRLQARQIDTLLIAGTSTSGCVRATIVDACQLGLRPIVVREAVIDRSPTAHQQALIDIETKYGDVVPIQNALDYIKRQ